MSYAHRGCISRPLRLFLATFVVKSLTSLNESVKIQRSHRH
jgi:hypothetical protein